MKQWYTLKSGVEGVRPAEKKDEHEIFVLLCLLHAENGLFGMNREKVIKGIQYATERQGGIIFVIEKDKHIVASMGMSLACEWYSDDEYLLERWNYVHPDHRQSDYARMLLEQGKWASEWFSRENNKPIPYMCGINSFYRTEAKIRMYARHMPCLGAFFMYGLAPRQREEIRREMAAIEEQNRKANSAHNREVRPAVETLLRVGQRGNGGVDHVR